MSSPTQTARELSLHPKCYIATLSLELLGSTYAPPVRCLTHLKDILLSEEWNFQPKSCFYILYMLKESSIPSQAPYRVNALRQEEIMGQVKEILKASWIFMLPNLKPGAIFLNVFHNV